MPTTVVDPYTQIANLLETTIKAEFSDLAYMDFHHDYIHESLGSDGKFHIAVSPNEDSAERAGTMAHDITIQFYAPFSAEVNPHQTFDPRVTTERAERMRQALQNITNVGTSHVWYFNVLSTRYPADATGNKSRFEMTLRAWGNDTGLIETTG